jgi:acetyltransferase-like isoleucine patch superfamily enzyme
MPDWLNKAARKDGARDVLVEDKVTLHHCVPINRIRVGFRSFATDSVLRNATIGRFCSIGRRCILGSPIYSAEPFSTHGIAASEAFRRDPAVLIGNDVWIGDHVTIMSGVTVGDGAVIEAGAVVNSDVEPYAVVSGNPAKPRAARFEPEICRDLLASRWWQYGDAAVHLVPPGSPPQVLLKALAKAHPAVLQPDFRMWDSQ